MGGQDLRIYRRAKFVIDEESFPTRKEEIQEQKILSKEKVKEFRKMLRRLDKKRRREDGDWEGSRKHKKKKKSHKQPISEKQQPSPGKQLSPEKPEERRSRPGNLRQKPSQRYQDALDELGLMDQEEDYLPKKKATMRPSLAHDTSSPSESSHEEDVQDEDFIHVEKKPSRRSTPSRR